MRIFVALTLPLTIATTAPSCCAPPPYRPPCDCPDGGQAERLDKLDRPECHGGAPGMLKCD